MTTTHQSYRINQEINLRTADERALKNDLDGSRRNLDIAKWVTGLLYFAAIFTLYVADIRGIAGYISNQIGDIPALLLFGIASILLPVFLSRTKEDKYRDIAETLAGGGGLSIAAILIMMFFGSSGVFFEMFTATSQQQHISTTAAEGSKTFKMLENTEIKVSGETDMAKDIAIARGKLARCEERKRQGKEPYCVTEENVLKSLLESESKARESVKTASGEVVDKKVENALKLQEEANKPLFKAIRDTFGVSINAGMIMGVAIMITIFELTHIINLFTFANRLRRWKQITGHLVDLRSQYVELTGYDHQPTDFDDLRKERLSPAPHMAAPVSGLVEKTKTAIGDEMLKANAGREQAHRSMTDALGLVGDKIDSLAKPDRPDLNNQTDQTGNGATTRPTRPADQTAGRTGIHNPVLGKEEEQYEIPATRPAENDQTDRARRGESNRPTLDHKTAVAMISAQVRGQLDSGKCKPEQRVVEIACQVAYDQMATLYPLPELDLTLVARSILANQTAGLPEPDLLETKKTANQTDATRPALPDPPHQSGLVGSVHSKSGLVNNQPDLEAVKKQAEIEELKRKLADQTAQIEAEKRANEAADRARAEADRKAKAEADRLAAEQAARAAAAAKAQEEADRKAAEEAAERGDLTDEQIALATTVLADAIRAGQLGASGKGLGHSKTAPILKAAGLPTSTSTLKSLNKLAGKRLVEIGLAQPHGNPGNGNPLFVIA